MADPFGFAAQQSKFQQNSGPMRNLAAAPGVLYPQQLAALQSLADYFADPPRPNPSLVCMPTGTGKSGVIAFMPYFLASDARAIRNVLIVTPGKDTQRQLHDDLGNATHPTRKFLYKAAQRASYNLPPYVLPSVVKTAGPLLNENLFAYDITISNAQSFHNNPNALWHQLDPNGFQLVIVDEAHHFPSSFWHSVVAHFGEGSLLVFCTATPFRSDGKQVIPGDIHVAYRLTRLNAVQSALIRNAQLDSLPGNNVTEGDAWVAILRRIQQCLAERNHNNLFPVAPNAQPPRHRAIAVALDVPQAEEIRQQAVSVGLHPVVYHSSLTKANRYQAKASFEKEESTTDLLIICGMLLEGYDFPPISICAIMEHLVSPVKFSQFVGRAIRRVRVGNNADNYDALIITHDYYEQQQSYQNYVNETLINIALGQQDAPLPQ